MRILRINEDRTVEELDLEMVDLMEDGHRWDAVGVAPGHDAWVRDDGIFAGNPIAMLAGQPVPLPAYVTGIEGERAGPATLAVEEVHDLVG